MSMLADPRRLMMAANHKRLATMIPLQEVQAMAHYCVVSSALLHELRQVCEAASASGCTINPQSLITWLDDNAGQLSPATFTPVKEEKTDAA